MQGPLLRFNEMKWNDMSRCSILMKCFFFFFFFLLWFDFLPMKFQDQHLFCIKKKEKYHWKLTSFDIRRLVWILKNGEVKAFDYLKVTFDSNGISLFRYVQHISFSFGITIGSEKSYPVYKTATDVLFMLFIDWVYWWNVNLCLHSPLPSKKTNFHHDHRFKRREQFRY